MALIDWPSGILVVDSLGNATGIMSPNKKLIIPIGDSAFFYQTAVPINGQNVQIDAGSLNSLLWLKPGSTIATATITLPPNNLSRLGQIVRFGSAQQITTLTIAGATTVYNAPSTLQSGDLFNLVKVDNNTWALQQ